MRDSKVKSHSTTTALAFTASTLLTLPAHAYRTGENSPELANRGRVAWASPRIAFSMNDALLPKGVTKAQMEEALASALDAWAAPDCGVVEPYFAGWTQDAAASKDGVNTIGWVEDWAGSGFPKLSPGTTVMQYRGHDGVWEIADADIYLDAGGYDWTTKVGADTSLQAVLTHEVGHALGMLHPCEPDGADGAPDCKGADSSEQATTMYPFYDAGQASLDADDVAGICYLYPVAGSCPQGCGHDEMCVDGECRAFCKDTLCAADEKCGFWGCASRNACLERYCFDAACNKTEDCGPLATCTDRVCTAGTADWGDACSSSRDCAKGACVEGVCQPDCGDTGECGPSGSCVATENGAAKGCINSRKYESGMRCAAGEDCGSGVCIFTATPSVCTEDCVTSATCPEKWSCGSVDGRQVCIPPHVRAAGGCSVAPALAPHSPRPLWLLLGLPVALLNRHRRRQVSVKGGPRDSSS